jgi:hypothetical protein
MGTHLLREVNGANMDFVAGVQPPFRCGEGMGHALPRQAPSGRRFVAGGASPRNSCAINFKPRRGERPDVVFARLVMPSVNGICRPLRGLILAAQGSGGLRPPATNLRPCRGYAATNLRSCRDYELRRGREMVHQDAPYNCALFGRFGWAFEGPKGALAQSPGLRRRRYPGSTA